ncbi:MAG: hypothetical protein U9N55_03430, partial [candidate division Zixibacteria bacterium]|nr:hypothetical protein [candidate division Zixibacteria bacterium]
MKKINWPDGKAFAFTVFDDTDVATLDNVQPVYELLAECGLRTTKSVWPLPASQYTDCNGTTCADRDYLSWLLQLKKDGFEIGYHMATCHTSDRDNTTYALDRFEELFGNSPKAMANHSSCRENMYWGSARIGGIRRFIYNLATRFRFSGRFRGHIENDPLF